MEAVFASAGDASSAGGSTVLDMADKAGAFATSDADSWLLYGRILMESGDLALAGEAFANARAGGTDEQKILPWLAEIAFNERRFAEVKAYLSALTRPGERGHELALVRTWWNK
jgi:hypothetical protein